MRGLAMENILAFVVVLFPLIAVSLMILTGGKMS
jgi:hypothetical protein